LDRHDSLPSAFIREKKSLVSAKEGRFKASFLWPNLTAQTAQSLALMRDASNGKAKNTFRKSGEMPPLHLHPVDDVMHLNVSGVSNDVSVSNI
jgi:hypothetical protein